MQRYDEDICYQNGLEAAKKSVSMFSESNRIAIQSLFDKTVHKRCYIKVSDCKDEVDYEDQKDWLDGFIDYVEEYLENIGE